MKKFAKYFAGSLIISFGFLMIIAIVLRAIGVAVPSEVARHLLFIWLGTAILFLPLAKNIVRV